MAYDDYRYNTQGQATPFQYTGPGGVPGTPSTSMWGAVKDRSLGTSGVGSAALMLPFGATAPIIAGGTALYEDFLKRGNPIDNVQKLDNWKNTATFGWHGRKKKGDAIRAARRNAVGAWRQSTGETMEGLLGQQGDDVRNDLAAEMRAALGAGGSMGDPKAIESAMTAFRQRYAQYMLGRQRATQAREVDAIYRDPRREADMQRRLGAQRHQGMTGIAEQFRIGTRENAFNQARRGTAGSSMDVEKRGQLGRGRDQSAMRLQAGLDQQAQQYRLQDQQEQTALKGLIYADDPNTAAALSHTLEGVQSQRQLSQEQALMRRQETALDSATSRNYSQALGGALTAGSRPLEYYLEHRGSGA